MNLDKTNFEVSDLEVIELAIKAIETELKKRCIFAKVTLNNGKIKSEDFTSVPMLFERLYIYGNYELEKVSNTQFNLYVSTNVRYHLFDGGENGISLFRFECILQPTIGRITFM